MGFCEKEVRIPRKALKSYIALTKMCFRTKLRLHFDDREKKIKEDQFVIPVCCPVVLENKSLIGFSILEPVLWFSVMRTIKRKTAPQWQNPCHVGGLNP